MTDARFPERWLSDRRVLRLSDAGHRLFVTSLAWSVSNRTDGVLFDDDLALMPRTDVGRADELAKAELWERDGDRWLIVDFGTTQTTAAQLAGLDHKRAMDRERQARHRESRATPSRESREPTESDSTVTRDTTRDGTRDTKARPGQARQGAVDGSSNETVSVWPDVGTASAVRVQCVDCGKVPASPLTGADGRQRCRTHHFANGRTA